MEKTVFNVSGMSCSHCERAVVNGLSELDGVLAVKVDLNGNTVEVEYDENKISKNAVKAEIIDIGYETE
jgi:copper chaperone